MKIQTTQHYRQWRMALVAILFCGLMSLDQISLGKETDDMANILSLANKDTFEYTIDGRNDPFVPFISEKSQSAKMDEILPVESQLSGMQLFEPGQLNLVAIVMVDDDDIAMVEDTTGKGYILRTGMEIGRRGIITSIEPNKVTIEETAFTRAGKKLTSNIVMLLKKEGEE